MIIREHSRFNVHVKATGGVGTLDNLLHVMSVRGDANCCNGYRGKYGGSCQERYRGSADNGAVQAR